MILRNGTAGALFDEMRAKIDPLILDILASSVEKRFLELVRYQIEAGGKRIRPLFAVLSCRALGGRDKDVLYAAAGLEILHNYTLIVDDIIDHSELRRGKPTLWARYGTSMAECVGIYYASAVFRAARLSSNPGRVSDEFSHALSTVVNGEIFDILYEQAGRETEPFVRNSRVRNVTPSQARKMASMKTAALFAASCRVGGICAGGTEEDLEALRLFGHETGVAFQIQDDILDLFGSEETFGKEIGKDIREHKAGNIVIAYALEELSAQKRARIQSALRMSKASKEDIEEVMLLIAQTRSKERAQKNASRSLERAKRSLACLPASRARNDLNLVADFVATRIV